MKFMLLVAAATTDVPYALSPVKNSPHPLKIIVATLCVLLTHDLFAIAKFVVKFSLNFAILLPHLLQPTLLLLTSFKIAPNILRT